MEWNKNRKNGEKKYLSHTPSYLKNFAAVPHHPTIFQFFFILFVYVYNTKQQYKEYIPLE